MILKKAFMLVKKGRKYAFSVCQTLKEFRFWKNFNSQPFGNVIYKVVKQLKSYLDTYLIVKSLFCQTTLREKNIRVYIQID